MRQQLRQIISAKRRALSLEEQKTAALQLFQHLKTSPLFINSQTIAFYHAIAGELDVDILLQLALQEGKNCYLPVLDPLQNQQLVFLPYKSAENCVVNRYKIPEPEYNSATVWPANQFDLVLVPLVAFDKKCNRLGRGAGYYDRTFSFLHSQKRPKKPYLLGIAYDWQIVDELPIAEWDIPLDAVATETHIYYRESI